MLALPPLAAEPIGHLGALPITNSMVNGWIAAVFFIVLALLIRNRRALVPRGFQNGVEAITEGLLNMAQSVTHDRDRAKRFLPIVGTLFVFILFSNWIGLLPGTGSIGIWQLHGGEVELIPILRPASSDLNLTLAISIFAVLAANVFGIMAIGFFKHLNKFLQFGTLWHSLRKGGINIFVGLIEFVVGLIELVSEIAKMVSLSLRLFGNVFAGEVLLTVIAGLVAFLVPLPFMALEMIVGIVQAMVFSLLTLVYLTVATEKLEAH